MGAKIVPFDLEPQRSVVDLPFGGRHVGNSATIFLAVSTANRGLGEEQRTFLGRAWQNPIKQIQPQT
jgi:hypothetical protein